MSFNYTVDSFKEAAPVKTFVKIALAGPQNSGKTVSALRLATGMGGPIAFIDSENRRALKYATAFRFKHFDLQPPFSAENYEAAIMAAVQAGFENIIVDSMSHEHEGPGGMLDQMEEYLDKKAGDDEKKREKMLMASTVKPKQARNRLIQFCVQRIHANVVLCFRAKEKMKMVKEKWVSDDGQRSGEKATPVNQGLQPIGGQEFWFEMDIVAMLPEKSMGKPDWEQTSSRINEYPAGKMTEYLHGLEQFNEETGRKLREFCTPGFMLRTGAGLAGHATPQEWKAKAVEVVTAFTQKAQFDAFMRVNGGGLQAVKDADESVYQDFMAAFMARQKVLEQGVTGSPADAPKSLL